VAKTSPGMKKKEKKKKRTSMKPQFDGPEKDPPFATRKGKKHFF